jgi:hypothetical protein
MKESKEIIVIVKEGFGRYDRYPQCDLGKKLLSLGDSVCFSRERGETLMELGYTFTVKTAAL